jgi:hypothetical protein
LTVLLNVLLHGVTVARALRRLRAVDRWYGRGLSRETGRSTVPCGTTHRHPDREAGGRKLKSRVQTFRNAC